MLDNNKIEKQFVTYEIALKLKELDFDEEVIALYDTEFVETKCKLNIFAFTVPNKGVVDVIAANYGSKHDGEMYLIAVCDNCIDNCLLSGKIKWRGNYMAGSNGFFLK